MPTNMMQHCTNVLCQASEDEFNNDESNICAETVGGCVNDNARAYTKDVLGYW